MNIKRHLLGMKENRIVWIRGILGLPGVNRRGESRDQTLEMQMSGRPSGTVGRNPEDATKVASL